MTETADYRLAAILLADPLLTTAEARALLPPADPSRPVNKPTRRTGSRTPDRTRSSNTAGRRFPDSWT